MSRFSPVVPAVGSGNPNIKLQSAAWGDQYTAHVRSNAAGDRVQPAGLLSTAPYHPPRKLCLGEDGTCRGILMRDSDYCAGHARGLGLIPNWSTKQVTVVEDASAFREPGFEPVFNYIPDHTAGPEPEPEPDDDGGPITEEIPIVLIEDTGPFSFSDIEPVIAKRRRPRTTKDD